MSSFLNSVIKTGKLVDWIKISSDSIGEGDGEGVSIGEVAIEGDEDGEVVGMGLGVEGIVTSVVFISVGVTI